MSRFSESKPVKRPVIAVVLASIFETVAPRSPRLARPSILLIAPTSASMDPVINVISPMLPTIFEMLIVRWSMFETVCARLPRPEFKRASIPVERPTMPSSAPVIVLSTIKFVLSVARSVSMRSSVLLNVSNEASVTSCVVTTVITIRS